MKNKAIRFAAPGVTEWFDIGEPPALGRSQFLMETMYSGVTNGTERHALMAEHFWKGCHPSSHGYQQVGKVVAVGDEVKKVQVGDIIFSGEYVGHRSWNVIDENSLYIKLPGDVDLKEAALLGVAGVGFNNIRRIRTAVGDKVWVCGIGPIGMFAAQTAVAVGAYVVASDMIPARLEVAKKCGIHETINAADPDATERIKKNAPYQAVIEVANRNDFMEYVRTNQLIGFKSVISLLAVHTDVNFNWSMLHGTQASIEVSCHFSNDDLRVLVHMLRTGLLKPGPVISDFHPVSDAIKVYDRLRDKPGEMHGIVFDWAK